MEFTSLVDTSLDLNCRPLRLLDDVPKQEVQSNFIGLIGRDIPSVKDEAGDLLEELNRVSAENKKLTEMLTVMCQNYNALRNQLMEHLSKQNSSGAAATDDHSAGSSRKRKAESSSTPNNETLKSVHQQQSESSSSDEDSSLKKPREEHIKTNTTRVYVRTEASDTTLIVKDGYQWRKYGQKVTRDNPSPRAYFKCSFAPSCPVKKKVQRSVEDQSILVATYEGEHNHPHPCSKTDTNGAVTTSPTSRFHVKSTSTTGSVPCSATQSLTESKTVVENKKVNSSSTNDKKKLSSSAAAAGGSENKPEFQQFLIEQMASSLTKDPSFQAALAAAISGKILLQNNDK